MKKIIVFGSLNMDLSIHTNEMPKQGETLEGGDFFSAAGGKGGNQAVAAAKLGAQTYMLGKIGQDAFGDELEKSLIDAGVQCEHLQRGDKSSGVAVIIRSKGDNRIICDYGANHQATAQEVVAQLEKIAQKNDILITQMECLPAETFQILHAAKQMGLVTILNNAPAKALPDDLYKSLDYLIINQTECHMLTGVFPKDHKECELPLEMLCKKGVASPLITLGDQGSICLNNGHFYSVASVKVKTVDTTAAGDTYIGAFASALAREKGILSAMDFASEAAALTVTRAGAQKSIPTLAEVENFKQ